MINFDRKNQYGFDDLCRIVALLRSPGGCPWDIEQTHESIRRDFLEETYEVLEAIDQKDAAHLCEELGDVLTQVVFHADMEKDAGSFTIDEVCDGICKKLIRRHPHVFGDVVVADTGEVLKNWDEIKKQERRQTDEASALDSVARTLPSLWRAEKLRKKAAKSGFEADALPEAESRLLRLAAEVQSGGGDVGEVLMAAANVARLRGVDPEAALTETCDGFIARFRLWEQENPKSDSF